MTQGTEISIVQAIVRLEMKLEEGLKEVNQKIDHLDQKIDHLDQKIDHLDQKIDKNSAEIVDLKISIGKVDTSLNEWRPSIQKIPDLAEKIGEAKNWRQIVIIAITVILTWLVKEGIKF